ncbi:MAG TPA: hypothetical protein VG795_16480 [Acidimicrobiia bacterium]|nr:hypothetical protein [Acidimicrobiia bacterium]
MQIRTDRGWIKAGLAVLVVGVLGGGVMAATGIGPPGPKKVTADGVTGKPALPAGAADQPLAAPPEGPTEAPEPAPAVGDKVKVGSDGGSVTVSAVEDNVSAGRLFGAGEGMKYIAVEVKGCAGPNEKNLIFEPAYFLLRLDDGTMHDPGPGAKKPSLEGGKMLPGKCLSGWVTFTVKDGSLATAVIYDGSRRLTWTVPPPKGAKPTTTTTVSVKAGVATSASSTTSTATSPTTSKAKASTSTTTAKKPKASSGSTTSTTRTSSTTGTKASSTTTTTGGSATTSTSGPARSSTTTTTSRRTVVTTPTDQNG